MTSDTVIAALNNKLLSLATSSACAHRGGDPAYKHTHIAWWQRVAYGLIYLKDSRAMLLEIPENDDRPAADNPLDQRAKRHPKKHMPKAELRFLSSWPQQIARTEQPRHGFICIPKQRSIDT